MKNFLRLLSIVILCSLPVSAQNLTAVSGTVLDSDTQTWNYATIRASLVLTQPGSAVYTSGGSVPILQTYQLSSGGVLSGTIPNNSAISPSGSAWRITVCSLTSAPCQTLPDVVISGASYNLGAYISANIQAPRVQATAVTYAYNSSEIQGPQQGNGWIDTTHNTAYLWNGGWQSYTSSGVVIPGADTQFIFNHAGTLGAVPALTYDGAAIYNNSAGNGRNPALSFTTLGNGVYDWGSSVGFGLDKNGNLQAAIGNKAFRVYDGGGAARFSVLGANIGIGGGVGGPSHLLDMGGAGHIDSNGQGGFGNYGANFKWDANGNVTVGSLNCTGSPCGSFVLSAPGNNTDIMFNDNGAVSATDSYQWNKVTSTLSVRGNINQNYTAMGPGYDYGYPGIGSQVGWSGNSYGEYDLNGYTQGIENILNYNYQKNGDGDLNGLDFNVKYAGGSIAGSDEGVGGLIRPYVQIGLPTYVGTVSTVTNNVGGKLLLFSSNNGLSFGVHRVVIDKTDDTQTIHVTATSHDSTGAAILTVTETMPAPTALGTVTTLVDVPKISDGSTVSRSFDLSLTTGTVSPSDYVMIGGAMPECVKVQSTQAAVSGGSVNITVNTRSAHAAGDPIVDGGWGCRFIENTAETRVVNGVTYRYAFYTLGTSDAHTLRAFALVPNSMDYGYIGTGTYNVYHGSRITSVVSCASSTNPNCVMQDRFNTEDSDAAFTTGATVEVLNTQHIQPISVFKEQINNNNPTAMVYDIDMSCVGGDAGCGSESVGDGTGSAWARFSNPNPDSMYTYYNNGTNVCNPGQCEYHVKDGLHFNGPVGRGLYFYNSPHGTMLEAQNYSGFPYGIWQQDDKTGAFVLYDGNHTWSVGVDLNMTGDIRVRGDSLASGATCGAHPSGSIWADDSYIYHCNATGTAASRASLTAF